MKAIIGISGRINAGKTACADILSERFGIPKYSFSKMIEGILINEGTPVTRQNLQDKGMEIINNTGYSGIAKLLLTTYGLSINTPCIIEGIRHRDVSAFYRSEFGNSFKLIFVECPIEIRFERIRGKLNKNTIINSIEDFIKTEGHPVEVENSKTKEDADFVVDNSTTVENLSLCLQDLKLQ